MKSKKIAIITLVISVIVFLTTGIFFAVQLLEKPLTQEDTTFYTATVKQVTVEKWEGGCSLRIDLNEYSTQVIGAYRLAGQEDAEPPRPGQTVSFRIENKKASQFGELSFVSVCSLETPDHVYYSLEDYNRFASERDAAARRGAGVGVIAGFLGTVASILWLCREKRRSAPAGTDRDHKAEKRTGHKRAAIWALVLSILVFVGALGYFVARLLAGSATPENTTVYTATVKQVTVEQGSDGPRILIDLNEYGARLTGLYPDRVEGLEAAQQLAPGQTVSFRIESKWASQFEEMRMVRVCSLETPDRVYFSLADYNRLTVEQSASARWSAILRGALGLLGIVASSVWLRREKRKERAA